jgi:RimK family alpha-L-glutamate ligase
MVKKILILTSGSKRKLVPFKLAGNKIDTPITTASFADIVYESSNTGVRLKSGEDIADFAIIYFRLVGKELETASLVADYAKKNGVKIVDKIYTNSQVFPVSQSKAQEMKDLSDVGIQIPRTFFGSLKEIAKNSPDMFGFPFVIKSTSGKKGKEVYLPKTREDLRRLIKKLIIEEKSGKKFFSQEFINAVKRIRVMVIGGKVVGTITQLTRWRKKITSYKPQADEAKIELYLADPEVKKLAIRATEAVGLDISGVDILKDEITGKLYVIEVNAAPSWKLVKKYCKVNIENEIIKYLQRQI